MIAARSRSEAGAGPVGRRGGGWLPRHRGLALGGLMVGLAVGLALAAPWLAPYDPLALNPGRRLRPPSAEFLWGTDNLGRDIMSRTIYGARLSLLVGAAVSLLSVALGTAVGLAAGYFRRLDGALMGLMDGLMAFPSILLAMAIMAAVGARVENIVVALAVVMIPRVARVVRSAVLVLRELPYIEAARATGGASLHILLRHLLPNCLPPLLVQATYTYALAILVEASLSFLGVGTPPEVPSLGNILADTRLYMRASPWMPLLPGLAIMWTVLGLNQLGDGLRDALDPNLRRL